jgi:AAA+ ATPase superfamily predicted ATPase
MNNITGPPVEGDDFFGREKEMQFVWERIEKGNNFIFPSPRRVGKTSFALKLLDMANNKGWDIVSVNLEQKLSEPEFIETFIDELKKLSWWNNIKDKGTSLFNQVKKVKPKMTYGDVTVALEWQDTKRDIYRDLSDLLDHNEKTLIFFDELTVLLTAIVKENSDGEKNAAAFLHWLRDMRIKSGSKIRWIFCSSVGIENFTHKYRISDTVNDIQPYKLLAYTKEQSIAMLENLGRSEKLKLTSEIKKEIVEKLDYCIPFFLQIMFGKIAYLVSIEDMPLDNNIVDVAYARLIEETHFNTWIERLDEQYGDNKKDALCLLKHLCQAKEGTTRENLINVLVALGTDPEKAEETTSILLYMLGNDGYLIEENGLYRFRSPLLRDFWFKRFVQ